MTSELPDGVTVDPVLVIDAICPPAESVAREIAASDVERWNGAWTHVRMRPFRRVRRDAEVGVA